MFLRKPFGPGWALVGDAGCRVDPITGQGITDAIRDADLHARALCEALGGARAYDDALGDYHRQRDQAVLPLYRFTAERARLAAPDADTLRLFGALRGNQAAIDQFVGLTAGTTSFDDFFAPRNMAHVLGAAA
jgi:flavin-dependent dehydrogenase